MLHLVCTTWVSLEPKVFGFRALTQISVFLFRRCPSSSNWVILFSISTERIVYAVNNPSQHHPLALSKRDFKLFLSWVILMYCQQIDLYCVHCVPFVENLWVEWAVCHCFGRHSYFQNLDKRALMHFEYVVAGSGMKLWIYRRLKSSRPVARKFNFNLQE